MGGLTGTKKVEKITTKRRVTKKIKSLPDLAKPIIELLESLQVPKDPSDTCWGGLAGTKKLKKSQPKEEKQKNRMLAD